MAQNLSSKLYFSQNGVHNFTKPNFFHKNLISSININKKKLCLCKISNEKKFNLSINIIKNISWKNLCIWHNVKELLNISIIHINMTFNFIAKDSFYPFCLKKRFFLPESQWENEKNKLKKKVIAMFRMVQN